MKLGGSTVISPPRSGVSKSGGGAVASGAMPGAGQFTIPAQTGVPNPKCPPGYSTTRQYGPNSTYPYAICTPLPQPVPVQAPAPAQRPINIAPRFTVSPSFQQQFTPQFSPVLQQQQDSPGATQAGSPIQIAEPKQSVTRPPPRPEPAPVPVAPIPKLEKKSPAGDSVSARELLELFRQMREDEKATGPVPVPVPAITAPEEPPAKILPMPQESAPVPIIIQAPAPMPVTYSAPTPEMAVKNDKGDYILPLIVLGAISIFMVTQK